MPAPHPSEFRRRAVELASLAEQPISAIAKVLRISESCLRNWMAQDDADNGNSSAARLTSDEKRELAELRRPNDPQLGSQLSNYGVGFGWIPTDEWHVRAL